MRGFRIDRQAESDYSVRLTLGGVPLYRTH
jgi:hypothetical protein